MNIAALLLGLTCCGAASAQAVVTPPSAGVDRREVRTSAPCYWSDCRSTHVEIDGHGFDFQKPVRGRGVVDGPWHHNGCYHVRRNDAEALVVHIQFGADKGQRSDMDIDLHLERGRARVTGAVKGKKIGTITTTARRVRGKFELRFAVPSARGRVKEYLIRWAAPVAAR